MTTIEWAHFVPGTDLVLGTALKGSLILLAACVGAVLLRHGPAARRHVVWALGLTCLLALPLLGGLLPSWRALPSQWAIERQIEGVRTLVGTPAPVELGGPEVVAEGRVSLEAIEPLGGVGPSPAEEGLVGAVWEAPPTAESLRVDWELGWVGALTLLLPVAWLLGFLALTLRIGLGLLGVRRVGRQADTNVPVAWTAALEWARDKLEVRRSVRLVRSDRVAVPVTWGLLRPVVALPTGAGDWDSVRLQQALLHEMAHVKRFDQPLLMVGQLAVAVHWFNPLAWLAMRGFNRTCELATDDLVLANGVRASDYAANLVEVARSIGRDTRLPAAAFAMARTSDLTGRVTAILDPVRTRAGASRWDVLALVIVAAGFVLPVAALSARAEMMEVPAAPVVPAPAVRAVAEVPPPMPAPVAPRYEEAAALASELRAEVDLIRARLWGNDAPTPDLGLGVEVDLAPLPSTVAPSLAQEFPCFDLNRRFTGDQVEVNESGMRAFWRTTDCTWTLRLQGEIHFTANERSVAELSHGGFFAIHQEGLGSDFSYEVREVGGRLEAAYEVGGEQRPVQDADSWLAVVIPEIYRITGLELEARVERLQHRGGTKAVLQEVSQMRSGHVARQYLQAVLESGLASEPEIAELLGVAERRIASDHEMRKLLSAAAFDLGSAAVRDAYMGAAATIESDYELRMALEQFYADGVSPEEGRVIVSLAERVQSDFELRELLSRAARELELEVREIEFFLDVASSITSDFEMRETLVAVLDQPALEDRRLAEFMDRIDAMRSDFERAELLRAIVQSRAPMDRVLADRLEASLETFDSDYEREKVRTALRAAQTR